MKVATGTWTRPWSCGQVKARKMVISCTWTRQGRAGRTGLLAQEKHLGSVWPETCRPQPRPTTLRARQDSVVFEERRTRCGHIGHVPLFHWGLGGSGRGLLEVHTTTSIACLSSFHLHVIQGESTDPVFQEFPEVLARGREGPSTQTPGSQHLVRSENPYVVRGLLRG